MVFGEIPGFPEGSWFPDRKSASTSGVHRPPQGGICGTFAEGAESIVVSGGYSDDEDYGDYIIYTGQGGRDTKTGKQIADQSLDVTQNASLVTSQLNDLPVRVVRGSTGDAAHSPASGYSYDGLFRVDSHWSKRSGDTGGFLVWQFLIVKMGNQSVPSFVNNENHNRPKGLNGTHGEPESQEPTRSQVVINRLVRNPSIAEYVKRLHQCKCQVCGVVLPVPKGYVSEGAHIRALGRPHDGLDSISNMLCLCPNHHAQFDSGGFVITDEMQLIDFNGESLGQLTTIPKHEIDISNIAYHRSLWQRT